MINNIYDLYLKILINETKRYYLISVRITYIKKAVTIYLVSDMMKEELRHTAGEIV